MERKHKMEAQGNEELDQGNRKMADADDLKKTPEDKKSYNTGMRVCFGPR